jgi:membrane-associated phospholipid phosphatase
LPPATLVIVNPSRRFLPPADADLRVRDFVQRNLPTNTAKVMSPLFPLGMPAGYVTIAYATAHWLRRRRRRGGPAIVAAAWTGWLAQRITKEVFVRERPRRDGVRRRIESFPSGHTTETTALALTLAYVLNREHSISGTTATLIGAGAPLLMGAYRVIDDEHWATDVMAGWVLGAAVAIACVATFGDSAGVSRDAREIRERASSTPRRRRHVRPEQSTFEG